MCAGHFVARENPVVDKLVVLAEGDIDLLMRAIRTAAAGKDSADLKDVVDCLVEAKRSKVVGCGE